MSDDPLIAKLEPGDILMYCDDLYRGWNTTSAIIGIERESHNRIRITWLEVDRAARVRFTQSRHSEHGVFNGWTKINP